MTTFGDHQLLFDLHGGRVIRLMDSDSEVVASIHTGWKGTRLPEFFGTVESEAFVVTKRQHDEFSWLSGNVIVDVTVKKCAISVTSMVMRYDLSNSFRVANMLQLKLIQEGSRLKIEGSCAEGQRDLAEVLACLLLHHSEERGPSS